MIEILAALSVVSVAVLIITSMFSAALIMSSAARTSAVAADLAQEKLNAVVHAPGAFDWPSAEALAPGQWQEVAPKDNAANAAWAMPAVQPGDPKVADRENAFYERFTAQAFARIPHADAAYLDVAVVIRWEARGRSKLLALSSAAPRRLAGDAS